MNLLQMIKKNITKLISIKNIYKILLCVLVVFLLLLPSILQGSQMSLFQNFVTTNGDFQNYNPVRRLLAGQTPYVDFTVYLGAGQLFSTGMILKLIGNTFKSSMFASAFLSVTFSALLIFTCTYLVLQNKKLSLWITIFLNYLFYGIVTGVYPKSLLSDLSDFVSPMYSAGNSARPIRWAIMPIFIIILLLGNKIIVKVIEIKKDTINRNLKYSPFLIYYAALSGFIVPWSNDMGVSMYLCTSFIYFLFLIRIYVRSKQNEIKLKLLFILKWILIYILISSLALIACCIIITYGHPTSWFKSCFEISSYQSWYYSSAKCCYWYSLIFDIFVFGDIFLFIIFCINIFKVKNDRKAFNYGMQAIILASSILVHLLYDFVTGSAILELLRFVLILFALSYLFKIVIYYVQNQTFITKYIKLTCLIFCLATITMITYNNLYSKLSLITNNYQGATYFDKLGGYNNSFPDSLKKEEALLKGKKVFSTYATAAEVLTDQFQPTGTDYIIHVLGDKPRENYMKVFRNGDFDYVCTVNGKSNTWEYWSCNVNWFFYRELFENYIPLPKDISGDIHAFWKKSLKSNKLDIDTSLIITKMNTSSEPDGYNVYYIDVTAPESFDGIADVLLNYEVKIGSDFHRSGGINNYVRVDNLTPDYTTFPKDFYFIPVDKSTYYIPIYIKNGKGQVKIYAYPEESAKINNFSAAINAIYPNFEDLISNDELADFYTDLKENEYIAANVNDTNWRNGINSNIILVDKKLSNYDQIIGKFIITEDGTINKILNARWANNYTTLECENPISDKFAYPNKFTIQMDK
jgi:hypothetical protein